MKTNCFNPRHHARSGPGGWFCSCCGPAPKDRKVAARLHKKRTYKLLDKMERIQMTIELFSVDNPAGTENDGYRSEAGHTMRREYCLTPNGTEMNGRWVLRDIAGKMIDFDSYRNDLAERNNFRIIF